MNKSNMNRFAVWAIAFGLSCCASGAETPVSIVQWGQPGGQTDILSARIDGDWNVNTTFDATIAASPDDAPARLTRAVIRCSMGQQRF
jgi:hypothetical protein